MTTIEALEDIKDRAGSWYDPRVVNGLLKLHGQPLIEVAKEATEAQSGWVLASVQETVKRR
jgi:response regulator RpfG family c-di-GMP phosphodiesterase